MKEFFAAICAIIALVGAVLCAEFKHIAEKYKGVKGREEDFNEAMKVCVFDGIIATIFGLTALLNFFA